MPIITELVQPSTLTTAVTIYVCAFCGADARLKAVQQVPIADVEAWVAQIGWTVFPDAENFPEAACSRCRPLVADFPKGP